MFSRRRAGAAVAVAATAALALSACGGSSASSSSSSAAASSAASSAASGAASSAAPATTGGSYSIALEEPQNLVPSNCYDLYCANVLNQMFTGLFRFETQADGTVAPVQTELVDSISTADGGTTWSIKIKDGWTFTNGEPITAQTFVDTWNFAAYADNGQQLGFVFGPSQLNVEGYDKVSVAKSDTKTMSGLTVVSPTEIQMKLLSPLGEGIFLNFLAGPQILPMPSVAFTDIDAFNKQPIGNGPYMMATPWTPDQKIEIVKNPDYMGTPGNADKVEFRIYNDTTAEWADLQAGNVDVLPQIPQAALAEAPSVLGDRYINIPGALSFSWNFFPLQSSTFAKKEVRQAIAMSIDQKSITEKLLYGTQTPATAFAPSTIPGGGTDACGESCTFDPAKAKELLAAAGGVPGNKVQIAALQGSPNTVAKAECDMIQANLGVECSLKLFPDFGSELDAYAKITAEDAGFIGGLGWGADNPTLQNMIAPLFGTGSPSNYIGYSNPKFDALIAEGNAAQDSATQISKWQEAQQVVYDDFVAYATTWRNTVAGISENVTNVDINPQGFINIGEIQVVNPS
jgi:oligopeptide transport system substrate-binding protein